MLEYEKEILTDLTDNDGLLVMARGLGMERILCGLLAIYNNPDCLVLVVGASGPEVEYITQVLHHTDNMGAPRPVRPPRCVTADTPVQERTSVYLEGGVLFVTSRILVVDLLRDRLPAHLITGIIVWKAHKILESCQEAFILRLFRQKNKTGFIKGLSNSAVSFTQGFCQVARVMKNLFVRRLFLYPRFHVTVGEALVKRKPEVVELHLRMTPCMVAAQCSLVDLVTATVHELKLVNKGYIDNDLLTPEHALSPSFERLVMCLLQPVWDQLSTKTRHLVADLRLLRTVNSCLSQYDCVTFYNLTSSLRTTEKALQSAGWLLMPPAEALFVNAKKRVFGGHPTAVEDIKKKAEKEAKSGSKKEDENPLGLTIEVNPKWACLSEVLVEVRENARKRAGPLPERCLIVTQDDTTAHQLQQVLIDGPERVLAKLFYQTIGVKMNLIPPAHLFSKPEPKVRDRSMRRFSTKRKSARPSEADEESGKKLKGFMKSSETSHDEAMGNSESNDKEELSKDSGEPSKDTGEPQNDTGDSSKDKSEPIKDRGESPKNADDNNPPSDNGHKNIDTGASVKSQDDGSDDDSESRVKMDETITLTQIQAKYNFVGDSSDSVDSGSDVDEEEREQRKKAKRLKKEALKKKYEEKIQRRKLFSSPMILVQSLRNYSDPFSLPRLLREVQPRYIILYDSDLDFIRQVEVWQAESAAHQCIVYLMIYKGTMEEQLYLNSVKREKDAFHYLIKEKASLVFPEHAEGRNSDHPDLQRDPRPASERGELAVSSRKGGQTEDQPPEQESRVIVDMREFRSELPSLIHKRGIEIDPVTIEVGDYILSPSMCVERKSLSDLVGSLNSGRLYSQAVAMTRHYEKPMLLIEFDQNKPFHLQASVLSNSRGTAAFGSLTQGEPDNRDVAAKLQLLTLHFPGLRLLWCSSPYATAEMFQLLKTGKPEPDVETAQAIKSDSCPLDVTEKFNPIIHDFMLKLPGITSKNIERVLRGAPDLLALIALDKQGLTDLLDNSQYAGQLHAALHATLTPEDIEKDTAKIKGRTTRKGLPKFGTR